MTKLKETGGETAIFGVARVGLREFRNYAFLDVELDAGFNVFHGPNAQGKTNLLEAIYFLSTTRLLRSSRDGDAIRHEAEKASIQAILTSHGTSIRFELERGTRKKAFLNELALKRASDVIGRIPTTSISTVDLEIAKGEPSDRRAFMDMELSQTRPAYLVALTHYKRALEQRNALLKLAQNGHVQSETFESWESQLATYGSQIRRLRLEFVEALRPSVAGIHAWMAPGERFGADYETKDPNVDEAALLDHFAATRAQDVYRGSTSAGPHRDDLSLMIDGQDVRAFGSQGQQRTAVVSLKLATLELAKERLGATPILLLDDILSDLDERRRAKLVEWTLNHAGQAALTCTEASAAGSEILSQARVFRVKEGAVNQE